MPVESVEVKTGSVPAVTSPAPPTGTEAEEPKIAPPGTDQPAPAGTPSAPAEQPEEQEPDLEAAPESSGDFARYKSLFKDHPELQKIIGREKAFSELAPNGSFSELRQILETFPSLADAEETTRLANEHRNLGNTLRESPVDFLESLRENDGNAYAKMIEAMPQILAETDANLYSSQARYYVREVFGRLFEAGQGNQDFLHSLEAVAGALGIGMGSASVSRPVSSETQRLRDQLKARDEQDRQQAYESFHTTVESTWADTVLTEIETGVKRIIKDVNQEQLKIIVPRVWDEVNKRLDAQPQTKADVQRRYEQARKGRTGPSEQREFIDFLTRKAKLVLPLAIKEQVNIWTKAAVATNNGKVESKQNIAAHSKDVGSGPQATTSVSGGKPPDGKPRHAKDIFAELQAGTYVAPK